MIEPKKITEILNKDPNLYMAAPTYKVAGTILFHHTVRETVYHWSFHEYEILLTRAGITIKKPANNPYAREEDRYNTYHLITIESFKNFISELQ